MTNHKQSKKDRDYFKLRKQYLSEDKHKYCKAKIPGICKGRQIQGLNLTIHHKKGKGIYLLDTSTWLECCLFCHEYIHDNPTDAFLLGFSESKLYN